MPKDSGGRKRVQFDADQGPAEYTGEGGPGDAYEGGTYQPHEHQVYSEALALLAGQLAQIASYSEVGNALKDGFQNLAAQLEPLRDIGPRTLPDNLDPSVLDAIEQIQIASARQSWDTGGAMPAVDVEGVYPIGQARPLGQNRP